MGGFESTLELIELCHIGDHSYVLDVGCGVGATACYLAETYGIKVVGVDLREDMIAWSKERAKREGVADRIELRVADALDLPFEDDLFNAVLSESVATFIEDKQKAVSEYVRVVKPGGYVGLNEEVWLKTPPPDMSGPARHLWEIRSEIPTADDWSAILKSAGLRDLVVEANRVSPRREASQLKRYRLGDMWRMFRNSLFLYFGSAAFRAYTKERRRLPRNLFQYLGYAVMAGRK
jgi:SAM-dependent methyltransferase